MGNTMLKTLAGPTISDMTKLAGIFFSTRDELIGNPDAEKARIYLAYLVHFASGQIPFGNIPGINTALKYGIIYRLQDMMNPGYTACYEKLVQRSQGQRFLVSPTSNLYNMY
ncbi:hypothetical protein [Parasaccharibacter apium]|nr:hypothetical protein [Parasaccharibacter apium]